MSTYLKEVAAALDAWAPWNTAEPWDNVGVLVESAPEVTGVICALDPTPAAQAFAQANGCNTLVTHHPVIFHALKSVGPGTPAVRLALAGMNVVSAHTNLDKAPGGVCETLARAVGLLDVRATAGTCVLGEMAETASVAGFAARIAKLLGAPVRYSLGGRAVHTAAVVSGAGGDYFAEAKALGADCLVTGEAGHHDFLDAEALGLPVIAATHAATERIIVPVLAARLQTALPGCPVLEFLEGEPFAEARP